MKKIELTLHLVFAFDLQLFWLNNGVKQLQIRCKNQIERWRLKKSSSGRWSVIEMKKNVHWFVVITYWENQDEHGESEILIKKEEIQAMSLYTSRWFAP